MIHYEFCHISASGLNFSPSSDLAVPHYGLLTPHGNGTGTGTGNVNGTRSNGTNMLHGNIHTGPKQEKEPGSIVYCCTGPVPCTCPGPVPCSVNKPLIAVFFLPLPLPLVPDTGPWPRHVWLARWNHPSFWNLLSSNPRSWGESAEQ